MAEQIQLHAVRFSSTKSSATIMLTFRLYLCAKYVFFFFSRSVFFFSWMIQSEEMKSTLIYGIHIQKQLYRSKSKLILALSFSRAFIVIDDILFVNTLKSSISRILFMPPSTKCAVFE